MSTVTSRPSRPRPAGSWARRAVAGLLAAGLLAACTGPTEAPSTEPPPSEAPPSQTQPTETASTPTETTPVPGSPPEPSDIEPLTYLAIGDSITRGFSSCPVPGTCEAASWAVGTEEVVDSVRQRLTGAGLEVETVSASFEGRTMADAQALVDEAFAEPGTPDPATVGLVTVMMGANDVCADSPDLMTTPEQFEASFTALLDSLERMAPDAEVVAMSIPDVGQVWEAASGDERARQVWDLGLCRTFLGGDDAARDAATERSIALDEVLARVCAASERCTYDGGAVSQAPVGLDSLSTWDYFHPSAVGQARLAEAAWPVVAGSLGLAS